MAKQPRIYKKKTDSGKSIKLNVRVTQEQAEQISQLAQKAGMSHSNFIRTSCLQKEINVMLEGRELSKAIQELRKMLLDDPCKEVAHQINNSLGQIVAHLYRSSQVN